MDIWQLCVCVTVCVCEWGGYSYINSYSYGVSWAGIVNHSIDPASHCQLFISSHLSATPRRKSVGRTFQKHVEISNRIQEREKQTEIKKRWQIKFFSSFCTSSRSLLCSESIFCPPLDWLWQIVGNWAELLIEEMTWSKNFFPGRCLQQTIPFDRCFFSPGPINKWSAVEIRGDVMIVQRTVKGNSHSI